jgi:hypothetical protein
MTRVLLGVAMLAQAACPAFAEGLFAEGMTCSRFGALSVADQVQVLSTVGAMGDDIEPDDQAAAREWAATVTSACAGHPDRLVPDAARDAMGD